MPDMYEVSDGRPRGASSSPSGRELPILFHLADVSRPRAKPVEKPMGEPAHILAAVESLRPAVQPEEVVVPLVAVAAPEVAPAAIAPVVETLAPVPAKLEVVPSAVAPPVIFEEPVVSLPPTVNTRVTPEIFETTLPAEMSKASETPKANEGTVSAESKPVAPSPPKKDAVVYPVNLRKKPKTSSSEDWFASHGKFIAIAFVLALIATVYFARANREKTVAKAEPATQPPLIETITQAKSSGEQNLWPESMTNNSKAADTGTAQVQTASATESKVELFAPQLVSEPTGDKKKDNLFEFVAAKGDERVAARGDETAKPAPAAPAEPTNYPVTSPSASRYPVTNPAATAYPATSSPALPANAPVAPPPMPPAYPGPAYQPAPQAGPPVDYRSQYPAAPAPPTQQQAWPPAGYGGQPGSYQPSDNTARGQRNERTGSGTY
jgi:hypothetical protein